MPENGRRDVIWRLNVKELFSESRAFYEIYSLTDLAVCLTTGPKSSKASSPHRAI